VRDKVAQALRPIVSPAGTTAKRNRDIFIGIEDGRESCSMGAASAKRIMAPNCDFLHGETRRVRRFRRGHAFDGVSWWLNSANDDARRHDSVPKSRDLVAAVRVAGNSHIPDSL
jgi:hypothetical protein